MIATVAVRLTEGQIALLTAVVIGRIEERRHDDNVAWLTEILVQLDLALAAAARASDEIASGRMRVQPSPHGPPHIETTPIDSDDEAMLQRALGVGPVVAGLLAPLVPMVREVVRVMKPADFGPFAVNPDKFDDEKAPVTDESGATGTQRSDWGERGEGSEEP